MKPLRWKWSFHIYGKISYFWTTLTDHGNGGYSHVGQLRAVAPFFLYKKKRDNFLHFCKVCVEATKFLHFLQKKKSRIAQFLIITWWMKSFLWSDFPKSWGKAGQVISFKVLNGFLILIAYMNAMIKPWSYDINRWKFTLQ